MHNYIMSSCVGILKDEAGAEGGTLPYETDGDARHLA